MSAHATSLPASLRVQTRRAFTLAELLVVIGLIATLTVGVGYALGGRAIEGVALASAQHTVAALVDSARAQATLHQTPVRLLIYASPPPNGNSEKYLRYLQVVRLENTAWVAAGEPVVLPAPICIVPPSAVPTVAGVVWPNNPATAPVSSFPAVPLTAFSVRGQSAAPARLFGGAGGGVAYYLQFEADGAVATTTANPTKIALSSAVIAPALPPQFNNPRAVRGLVIRKSGAVTLVNDATGF